MKRNRYDLNDRGAYDGRPVKRSAAISPRVPAKVRAGGRPAYTPATDPTAGRHGSGAGARRPRGNTMRNARMGGTRIRYYEPAELISDAITTTSVHAPARIANRRYDPATYQDTLAAAEHEGMRQRAMAEHSQLRTTGAIRIDPYPGPGPVWSDD